MFHFYNSLMTQFHLTLNLFLQQSAPSDSLNSRILLILPRAALSYCLEVAFMSVTPPNHMAGAEMTSGQQTVVQTPVKRRPKISLICTGSCVVYMIFSTPLLYFSMGAKTRSLESRRLQLEEAAGRRDVLLCRWNHLFLSLPPRSSFLPLQCACVITLLLLESLEVSPVSQ